MIKESNPNPNYIPPMIKHTTDGKCPFRKRYYVVSVDKEGNPYRGLINFNLDEYFIYIEEEFQNCIGKECARWTTFGCK